MKRAAWLGPVLVLGWSSAAAAAPAAHVHLRVDGGAAVELDEPAAPIGPGGELGYADGAADPGGGWSLTWSYTVDTDPAATATVNGELVFANGGPAARTLEFALDVPTCPIVVGPARYGGVVSVTLVADADGGHLTTIDGLPLWTGTVGGGQPFGALFVSPFQLDAAGGPSNASTSQSFGTPIPSLDGPPAGDRIGVRIELSVTPGDEARVNGLFALGADAANLGACEPGTGGAGGTGAGGTGAGGTGAGGGGGGAGGAGGSAAAGHGGDAPGAVVGAGGAASTGAVGDDGTGTGCGCRAASADPDAGAWALVMAAVFAARRRGGSRARSRAPHLMATRVV